VCVCVGVREQNGRDLARRSSWSLFRSFLHLICRQDTRSPDENVKTCTAGVVLIIAASRFCGRRASCIIQRSRATRFDKCYLFADASSRETVRRRPVERLTGPGMSTRSEVKVRANVRMTFVRIGFRHVPARDL